MKRSLFACGLALLAVMGVAGPGRAAAPAPVDWPTPADPATLPQGAWRDMVMYGQKLIVRTFSVLGPEVPDPAMRYAGNNLACQNCHLNGGTQRFGLPLIGVYGAFPAYMGREDEVRTLEDRINGCMERSMNGRALPADGKEMKAMLAYIQYVSTGIPVGKNIEGRGSAPLPLLKRAASPMRGATVYQKTCAVCHQPDGQGKRNGAKGDAGGYQFPPLWGPDSFNNGAGMHRLIAAATFVHANMPVGTTYTSPALTGDDAWDVAAYINAQPRPVRAHLERDYPNRSRKPVDAPFPPFADSFSLQQHRVGPFQPITDALRGKSPAP
ncbi:MAG: c-type cytochrome [Rhodospirillaceae bacterium]|nr:c-type cytochrome [Rhodospirillaceae bacterium]